MLDMFYLAIYDHKYGHDYSLHKTEEGANNWFLSIVEGWKEDFIMDPSDPWINADAQTLVDNWTEVSGETEFFRLEQIALNE